MLEYKHLSLEEQRFFVEHGWLRVKKAIKPEYVDAWMADLWTRLGWKEDDKSTWTEEYLKMPRHREVRCEEFCPEAWDKSELEVMCPALILFGDMIYHEKLEMRQTSENDLCCDIECKRCRGIISNRNDVAHHSRPGSRPMRTYLKRMKADINL